MMVDVLSIKACLEIFKIVLLQFKCLDDILFYIITNKGTLFAVKILKKCMFTRTFLPKGYLQEVLILCLQSWLKQKCTY